MRAAQLVPEPLLVERGASGSFSAGHGAGHVLVGLRLGQEPVGEEGAGVHVIGQVSLRGEGRPEHVVLGGPSAQFGSLVVGEVSEAASER